MKLSRVVAVRNLVVGSLAEQSRAGQRTMFQPRQSTVQVVFEKLRDISTLRGHSFGRQEPYPMGGRGEFEEVDCYPMASHMNKTRGGQVLLEGPFARGIAGTVSGWANQAKLVKVEQQTKLAEKQAMLFKHSNATLLPMIWSGQFSDYKLQCGAEIIDVHKMILAARSPFFVELMMKNPQHCVITNIDMDSILWRP